MSEEAWAKGAWELIHLAHEILAEAVRDIQDLQARLSALEAKSQETEETR